MGVFDIFRRRAERESALPPSASVPGSSASAGEQPVVGQRVSGLGDPGFDIQGGLEALGGLGGLLSIIQQAARQGNLQVSSNVDVEGLEPQTVNMQGTGLREEIFEIMRRHGIDPDSGQAQSVDASAMPRMQQEMLEALSRHGLNFGSAGASVQIRPDAD